jgi:hypothetical protein
MRNINRGLLIIHKTVPSSIGCLIIKLASSLKIKYRREQKLVDAVDENKISNITRKLGNITAYFEHNVPANGFKTIYFCTQVTLLETL